jgi:hypothetical protein
LGFAVEKLGDSPNETGVISSLAASTMKPLSTGLREAGRDKRPNAEGCLTMGQSFTFN